MKQTHLVVGPDLVPARGESSGTGKRLGLRDLDPSRKGETSGFLHHWLGGKLDQDIDMLAMIASGEFKQTPRGAYLMSLNDAFPPEVRGDMLTLLHLGLELSAGANGDLMRREAGLEVAPDPELDSYFKQLRYLEKSIGPTGMRAIRPLLARSPCDLWEMHQLKR